MIPIWKNSLPLGKIHGSKRKKVEFSHTDALTKHLVMVDFQNLFTTQDHD